MFLKNTDELDELLRLGDRDSASHVVLNDRFEGDREAQRDEALPMSTVLSRVLKGDTRSFTALVGWFGHSGAVSQQEDRNSPKEPENPAQIILREAKDDKITVDNDVESRFRLAVGVNSSKAACDASRAWYWLCRYRHEADKGIEETDQFRNDFLTCAESYGFRTASRKLVAALPGSVGDSPYDNCVFDACTPGDFANSLATESADETNTLTTALRETLYRACDASFGENAAILLGFLLQRRGDFRFNPKTGGKKTRVFHPKMYVVERAYDSNDGQTVSMVGSHNWTEPALGTATAEGITTNVEVATIHVDRGHTWDTDTPSTLGRRVCGTANHLFGNSDYILGAWDHRPAGEQLLSADRLAETTEAQNTFDVVTPGEGTEEGEEEPDSEEAATQLPISERVAALLEHLVQEVLGGKGLGKIADDELFRSESTFGGLEPQRYQFDGATRLSQILSEQRGAFLTDEAGLGKTLIAKMVASRRLASLLASRRSDSSETSVRFSIVAPARLIGDDHGDGQDVDDATGWHAHAIEIEDAVRQLLARHLQLELDVEGEDPTEAAEELLGLLKWRVLSTSSFSRKLEEEKVEKSDYEAPEQQIVLRDEVVDDLFHVATSELVVVDESHNFRNPDSRGTRTFRFCTSLPVPGEDWEMLPKNVGEAEHVETRVTRSRKLLCLSATPFNNRLKDLTTQIGHFGRHQNWELALERRFENYTRGQQMLSRGEEAHIEENPLITALTTWKHASHGHDVDAGQLRSTFETLLKFSHEHFNSGRKLDVDDKRAEERKRRHGEEFARGRVSDRGPDYEWDEQYADCEQIFAHAQEWFEQLHDDESDVEPDDQSIHEARARLESLLTKIVVQRSRARVLRIASATRDENIDEMFRKPRIPRHPLALNSPNSGEGELDEAISFEAKVLASLHHVLATKTGDSEEGDEEFEEENLTLTLFPYEVSVFRGRAGQSGSAKQAAQNTFGFQIVNLIKRLQSSPYAFLRTLLRGPLRKALFEVALVERALEDDEIDWEEAPADISEHVDTCGQVLDLFKRKQLTARQSFDAVMSIAQMIGGSTRDEPGEADKDEAFYRRFSGCLDDTNQRREFREAYDKLKAGLVTGDIDQHQWIEKLFADIAENEQSQVLRDISVALDWAANLRAGKYFNEIPLFNELYHEDLKDPLQLRSGERELHTLYGTPFSKIRRLIRHADYEDNIEDLVTPLSNWLNKRFRQDGRVLTLIAWMFIQAAVRVHNDEIEGSPALYGGTRTLIFSEYTDTQEYLLSLITTLLRLFEQRERQPEPLRQLRDTILEAMEETAELLQHRSLKIQQSDKHEQNFTDPEDYEPPVNTQWIRRWTDACRERDYEPLRDIALELRDTTGRICSDRAEFLFADDGDIEADSEIVDSDAIHDARADFDADEPDVTTVADDILLDAFSPWYQIAPSADPQAEKLEEAAKRLTRAGKRPCHTLFATEVLAEGVNLQECGTVIHYDLPWNPTHLIQRNGRIDRRIFDTYENESQRKTVERTLRKHYEDFESPTFDPPKQVYHMTVVPVEPALDEDGDTRANRVRQILFKKLQAIRALFGLAAWPVVLGAEDAEKVLNGELDYETPGFRRREELFAKWRLLHEHAAGESADLEEVDTLTFQLPDAFRDQLRAAVTGLTDDEEASDVSWPELMAASIGTWTPSEPRSKPCRSGVEYQSGGVISGNLFLGSSSSRDERLDRMIGWTALMSTTSTSGKPRLQFRPALFGQDGYEHPVSLTTLREGKNLDDFTPNAPTSLVEELLVELLTLLEEGGSHPVDYVEAKGTPSPSIFTDTAGDAATQWLQYLNSPRQELSPARPPQPRTEDSSTSFNLWIFIEPFSQERKG